MKHYYFSLFSFLSLFCLAQTPITSSIIPDLSAYGETTNYAGEGEYQIFIGADNILDKPIILVDGFDPADSRDIPSLYSSLDFASNAGAQNLADLLRAQNFDVIILNFPVYTRLDDNAVIDGGTDFIERNAMILVELLEVVNTAKANNSPDQNVIIGPSMGGIISKYALSYMEANTLDADTRLYISFDSPHLGANVPIGLQHQLNYLAFNDTNPVPEIQPLIDNFLNSSAARQLLLDHFESHLLNGSSVEFDPTLTLPEPHPFRNLLETNLNTLTPDGFPQNVRNVAIINGSGIGSTYSAADGITPVTNGFEVVDVTLPVDVDTPFGPLTIDIEIDINLTPNAGNPVQVSRFFAPIPVFPDVESIADSGTINFDGVDAAPGGLFDLSGLTGDIGSGGGIAQDFLNALQIDKFSFIPSVSALALEITEETSGDNINWFHTIDLAGRATTNNTPFDNTFLPDNNEGHTELTEDNVNFALSEILNPPLTISENTLSSIKLESNVITDQIVLLSEKNSKAEIMIIDGTGKSVFTIKENLTHRSVINVDLAAGFYILNVVTDTNEVLTSKFFAN